MTDFYKRQDNVVEVASHEEDDAIELKEERKHDKFGTKQKASVQINLDLDDECDV